MHHYMTRRRVTWYELTETKKSFFVRTHFNGTVLNVDSRNISAMVEKDGTKLKVVVDLVDLTEL